MAMVRLEPLNVGLLHYDNSYKAHVTRMQYTSNRCSGLLDPIISRACMFQPDSHPTESKSNLSEVEYTPFKFPLQRIQEKLDPWGFEIIIKNYSIGDGVLITSDRRPYIFDIDYNFDGLIEDYDFKKWVITLYVSYAYFHSYAYFTFLFCKLLIFIFYF
jgi:hypothetical protein